MATTALPKRGGRAYPPSPVTGCAAPSTFPFSPLPRRTKSTSSTGTPRLTPRGLIPESLRGWLDSAQRERAGATHARRERALPRRMGGGTSPRPLPLARGGGEARDLELGVRKRALAVEEARRRGWLDPGGDAWPVRERRLRMSPVPAYPDSTCCSIDPKDSDYGVDCPVADRRPPRPSRYVGREPAPPARAASARKSPGGAPARSGERLRRSGPACRERPGL